MSKQAVYDGLRCGTKYYKYNMLKNDKLRWEVYDSDTTLQNVDQKFEEFRE